MLGFYHYFLAHAVASGAGAGAVATQAHAHRKAAWLAKAVLNAAALLNKAVPKIPDYHHRLAVGQYRVERIEGDRLAHVHREGRAHAEGENRLARQVYVEGLFGAAHLAGSWHHYIEHHLVVVALGVAGRDGEALEGGAVAHVPAVFQGAGVGVYRAASVKIDA